MELNRVVALGWLSPKRSHVSDQNIINALPPSHVVWLLGHGVPTPVGIDLMSFVGEAMTIRATPLSAMYLLLTRLSATKGHTHYFLFCREKPLILEYVGVIEIVVRTGKHANIATISRGLAAFL
ncbi:hypothetical protein ACJX0J_019558, partial [Zea mays]